MHELRDLDNVTEEEIDSISIPAVVKDEQIIFNESDYEVEDGIMFFKRPLKVDIIDLNFSTLDRMSIIKSFNTDYTYVFAISAAKEFNENLIEFSKRNGRKGKKYGFWVSWSSEELNSID